MNLDPATSAKECKRDVLGGNIRREDSISRRSVLQGVNHIARQGIKPNCTGISVLRLREQDSLSLAVDIQPAQPENFRPAHSGERQQSGNGPQPIWAGL